MSLRPSAWTSYFKLPLIWPSVARADDGIASWGRVEPIVYFSIMLGAGRFGCPVPGSQRPCVAKTAVEERDIQRMQPPKLIAVRLAVDEAQRPDDDDTRADYRQV